MRLRVVVHWQQWCLFRRYQAAAARALWVKHTRQRVMDLWRYQFIPQAKARCRHLQALWLKVCCPLGDLLKSRRAWPMQLPFCLKLQVETPPTLPCDLPG